MSSIQTMVDSILAFRNDRDWARFHTPKNLAAAISIEAAEIQETMLWKTAEQVSEMKGNIDSVKKIADEIADVCIYSILLANEFEIDILKAIEEKLADNAIKYPIHLARGNAIKYTEFGEEPKKG